jgi:hypothetical protein
VPKSVTVADSDEPNEDGANPGTPTDVMEKPSAREKLKEWEGAGKRETKSKSIKLSRDSSGIYTISFRNDSGFSKLKVRMANGSESEFLVPSTLGVSTASLAGLSTSALEGYPNASSYEYKRFPFRFTAENGASASGEMIISGGSQAFEIDENILPK